MASCKVTVTANPIIPSFNSNGCPIATYDFCVQRFHRVLIHDPDGSFLHSQDYSVTPEERKSIIMPVSFLNLLSTRTHYFEETLAIMHVEAGLRGVLAQAIFMKAHSKAREHSCMCSVSVKIDIEIRTIEAVYSTRRPSASVSTRQRLRETIFTITDDDPEYADLDNSCCICFEELRSGTELIKTPCDHIFHGECILRWLDNGNSCPLCRFQFD